VNISHRTTMIAIGVALLIVDAFLFALVVYFVSWIV
jgi:hypothetical protein